MNGIANGESLFSEKESRAPTAILYFFIVLLVGLLLFFFFIAYSPINGESMENTIYDGQSVVLQRRGYTLRRGDLVTADVSDKQDGSHNIIKRVLGLGGDRLLFVRSQNTRNVTLYICKKGDTRLSYVDEPYIKEPMRANVSYGDYALLSYVPEDRLTSFDLDTENTDPRTEELRIAAVEACISIPSSHVFLLGDNRNNSSDSRRYGTQPTDRLVGKVIRITDDGTALDNIMRFLFGI